MEGIKFPLGDPPFFSTTCSTFVLAQGPSPSAALPLYYRPLFRPAAGRSQRSFSISSTFPLQVFSVRNTQLGFIKMTTMRQWSFPFTHFQSGSSGRCNAQKSAREIVSFSHSMCFSNPFSIDVPVLGQQTAGSFCSETRQFRPFSFPDPTLPVYPHVPRAAERKRYVAIAKATN